MRAKNLMKNSGIQSIKTKSIIKMMSVWKKMKNQPTKNGFPIWKVWTKNKKKYKKKYNRKYQENPSKKKRMKNNNQVESKGSLNGFSLFYFNKLPKILSY